MAVALSMALVVGVAQLLTTVARQRRLAKQHAVASLEAGNLIEHLVSRPWDDTTAQHAESATLSSECSRYLPQPRLTVYVTEESDDVRRISVEIDWESVPGRRGRPVRLVGWKFRNGRDGP